MIAFRLPQCAARVISGKHGNSQHSNGKLYTMVVNDPFKKFLNLSNWLLLLLGLGVFFNFSAHAYYTMGNYVNNYGNSYSNYQWPQKTTKPKAEAAIDIVKMTMDPSGTLVAYIRENASCVDQIYIKDVSTIFGESTNEPFILSKDTQPSLQPRIEDIEFVSNDIIAIVTKNHDGKLLLQFYEIKAKRCYNLYPSLTACHTASSICFLKETFPLYDQLSKNIIIPHFIIIMPQKNNKRIVCYKVRISKKDKLCFDMTPMASGASSSFYSSRGLQRILTYANNHNLSTDIVYCPQRKKIDHIADLTKGRYVSVSTNSGYKLALDSGGAACFYVVNLKNSKQQVVAKIPNVKSIENCSVHTNKHGDPLFITVKDKQGNAKNIPLTLCMIIEQKEQNNNKTVNGNILVIKQRMNEQNNPRQTRIDSLAHHIPVRRECEDAISVVAHIAEINKTFHQKSWERISASVNGKYWLIFVKNDGYYLYKTTDKIIKKICKIATTVTNKVQNSSYYYNNNGYYYYQ
jgi:hypothetical protein